jgi:AcrR family transcriptional regulator
MNSTSGRAKPSATSHATPRRKTDRTRLSLVSAVRESVEATGGFTADRVARRAGSSPATFYNHFASKQDALRAAFEAVMDDLVRFVDAQLRIERVLESGLPSFANSWVAACATFFRANSRVFSAAQIQLPTSKALRDVYRVRESAAFETFERFIRLGQTAQVFRGGDPAAIAQAMMVTSEGYNNSGILRMQNDDALHRELTYAVTRMLEPAS